MYKLRSATLNDAKLLFTWANDDETRSVSLMRKQIEWEEHVSWLVAKLDDKTSHIYILNNEVCGDIGVIRFDERNGFLLISYVIAKLHRKKGMGTLILQLGMDEIIKDCNDCQFLAFVQCSNVSSVKIFNKLKFVKERIEIIDGRSFYVYSKYGNK